MLGWRDSDGDGPVDPIDPGHYVLGWIPEVNLGDQVRIWDVALDFVKYISVTNDNILFFDNRYWLLWDGTNFGYGFVAPVTYLYVINSEPEEVVPLFSGGNYPILENVEQDQNENTFTFTLSQSFAYIHCVATSQFTGDNYFVLRDKLYDTGTYDVYYGLPEDAYNVEILAWRPDNMNSNVIDFEIIVDQSALVTGPKFFPEPDY